MKEDTTRSIMQIKAGISVQKWEEQIRACQESGQTVKEWCAENGIPVGTYYSRLRRIRETALTEEQQAFLQTSDRRGSKSRPERSASVFRKEQARSSWRR